MKIVPNVVTAKRPMLAALAVCWLLVASGGALLQAQEGAAAEPSSLDTLMDQTSRGNTVQAAQAAYHQGLRELERAEDLAAKAAEMEDASKSEKLLAKSVKANENAVQQLTGALQQNPKLIEAYDALGLAYRRLGKYQEALEIHAIALRRDPDSMDNFRGWSEALMQLDMLGNATTAYATYVEADSPRAPILMDEIKKWLAVKQDDPGELEPEHVQRLADWIAQQEQGG